MNNIPIVMYHCINDHPQNNPLGFLSYKTTEFRQHLRYLQKHGFHCVTFPELWRHACNGTLADHKYAVLTFDDGFLDNWLLAADLLDEYGARGTIFVNPDFADDGPVRCKKDVPDAWGHINYTEMKELESRGSFDIQSHTMTHDFEFVSDKVIDIYSPDKFDQYYWLAWKHFKNKKPQWCENLSVLKSQLPSGYPIFEYDRAILHPRFTPSQDFTQFAIEQYRQYGPNCLSELNRLTEKGTFETEEQWIDRVRYELRKSKTLLESKLDKPIEYICFPGGAYNHKILQMTQECGYKAYMVSSRDPQGDNFQALMDGCRNNSLVGLKRISFSKRYPKVFRNKLTAYLSCKFKIESFRGELSAKTILKIAKFARGIIGGRT